MRKAEFVNRLQEKLSQLPPEEIRRHREYYEEMLADMMEDGMTEEESTGKLGNPDDLARQILEELPLHSLVSSRVRPKNGWSAAAVVLAVLGAPLWGSLAIAGIAVAASLYLTVWALAIGVYALVLALGCGSAAAVIGAMSQFSQGIWAVTGSLGLGLLLAALCCLGVAAAYYVTRGVMKASRWMFVKMKTLFMK